MRLCFEISIFLAIFGIAVLLCASVIWLAGYPLQVQFSDSIAFALILLLIVLPAIGNLWIVFRGSDAETPFERMLAGLRGFGMLLCAIVLFVVIAFKSIPIHVARTLFVIGGVLWWGSVPVELWLRHRRHRIQTRHDQSVDDRRNEL